MKERREEEAVKEVEETVLGETRGEQPFLLRENYQPELSVGLRLAIFTFL